MSDVSARDSDELYEKWLSDRIQAMGRVWVVAGIVLNVLAALTYFLMAPGFDWRTNRLFQLHVVLAAVMGVWKALLQGRVPAQHFLFAVQFALVAGYAHRLHVAVTAGMRISDLAIISGSLMFISFVMVLMIPIRRVVAIAATAAAFWLMGFVAWYAADPAGEVEYFARNWVVLNGFNTVMAVVLEIGRIRRWRSEMDREFRMRVLITQNERLRFERDLIVAREIQDSFSPGEFELESDGIEARCFQEKSRQLGGDWLAVRKNPDGGLVVAVADATGKGVQAALVVHAVQSLWVEALMSTESFDPGVWLRNVNNVLVTLGRNKAHTLSMGLAVVSQSEVKYWGAGHVPAFLAYRTAGSGLGLKSVVGGGSILGLQRQDKVIEPVTVQLGDLQSPDVLIGTDGIFWRGTLTRERDVLKLLEVLHEGTGNPLEASTADDDKVLVWVRRSGPGGVRNTA